MSKKLALTLVMERLKRNLGLFVPVVVGAFVIASTLEAQTVPAVPFAPAGVVKETAPPLKFKPPADSLKLTPGVAYAWNFCNGQ